MPNRETLKHWSHNPDKGTAPRWHSKVKVWQFYSCTDPNLCNSTSVHHFMLSETTFTSESLVTLVALVWFITSVCPHMVYKFITSVFTHVVYKGTLLWKSFVTLIALIWVFTSVCPHVKCKNITLWKRLITLVTLVWFITSVCPYLTCKITILWKRLITLVALVWFITSIEEIKSKNSLTPNIGAL